MVRCILGCAVLQNDTKRCSKPHASWRFETITHRQSQMSRALQGHGQATLVKNAITKATCFFFAGLRVQRAWRPLLLRSAHYRGLSTQLCHAGARAATMFPEKLYTGCAMALPCPRTFFITRLHCTIQNIDTTLSQGKWHPVALLMLRQWHAHCGPTLGRAGPNPSESVFAPLCTLCR